MRPGLARQGRAGQGSVSNKTPFQLTPDGIRQAWDATGALPPAHLTPKRRAQLLQRIREHPDPMTWRLGLRNIAVSAVCHGANDRGWVATFDWLCARRDAIQKAAEGLYDRVYLSTDQVRAFDAHRRAVGPWCAHEPACADRTAHHQRLLVEWLKAQRDGG